MLWLIRQGGLDPTEVNEGLFRNAGLAGLSVGSGDMRGIVAHARAADRLAELAFEVYIHRLRREIAAMTASLGGVDVLAFTGGVGEHMPEVRAAAVDGLEYLGVSIDPAENELAAGDHDISGPLGVACVVVATGEAVEIAKATQRVVDGGNTATVAGGT